jgi:hypothetical protein
MTELLHKLHAGIAPENAYRSNAASTGAAAPGHLDNDQNLVFNFDTAPDPDPSVVISYRYIPGVGMGSARYFYVSIEL